jgi:hypothetical protein
MEKMVMEISSIAIERTQAAILYTRMPNESATNSYSPSNASQPNTLTANDEHSNHSSVFPSTASQSNTVLSANDEDSIRESSLPHGKMDSDTKRRILASKGKMPRFLFRGWRNSEQHASGGDTHLNTTDKIVPHAFHFKNVTRERTIYDMSLDTLQQQALDHLHTEKRNFSTQFSSWASSLKVALYFGSRPKSEICNQCKNLLSRMSGETLTNYTQRFLGHISIVDTAMIGSKNVFVYVPSLDWLSGECRRYKHEYLAHGVIERRGLKAILLQTVVNGGIPDSRYSGIAPAVRASPPRHIESYPAITEQELRDALRVAELYGGDFVVPVAVAILCQKTRESALWRSGDIPGLGMVAEALKDYNIPLDWCRTVNILTDAVDSGGYGDVDQMIMLLRALLHPRRGQRARIRNRQLEAVLPEVGEPPDDRRNVSQIELQIER